MDREIVLVRMIIRIDFLYTYSLYLLGMHYANLYLRMALAKILAKYRFTTKHKFEHLKTKWGVVLKLKNDYIVQAHLR